MFAQRVRLGLAVFFATLSLVLFNREWVLPEAFREKFREGRLAFGAWFALVMAGWNLAKWYVGWSDPRVRASRPNPLSVRNPPPAEPYAPNPELDFLKVPDADKPFPDPSPNGDHKG